MALMDEEDPHLRTLNLGDSGVIILRQTERGIVPVFRSEERQYKFNHPYQCGTNYKLPYHSEVWLHKVQHKDLIILGSDGLFDNLFDEDLTKCIGDLADRAVEP